ncbi:hypothetical protein [Rothia aeria]|uniref:hypothetical protein n=1 Tax=Rothia aeria TaxID=172042 RepID=UPI00288AD208|nr:hypothetical protein [Rothia aeria]
MNETITDVLGRTFAYSYDKACCLTILTNENGETYRLDYGPTDNLIQETSWDGNLLWFDNYTG